MMTEWSCIFAAITLMAANILKIIYYGNVYKDGHSHWNWETYRTFDTEYLEEAWIKRIDREKLAMASGFLNCLAWFVLAYPIIQMAWILSKKGTKSLGLNVAIIMFVLAGGMFELLSTFFYIGMNMISSMLFKMFENDGSSQWVPRQDVAVNDGLGWQTLEMNHVLGRGFIKYTDSLEWICLSCMFIFTFASVRYYIMEDDTCFGSRWNILGLFIGFVCILEFVSEIVRFEYHMQFRSKIFGIVSLAYSILNRLIFIPAWVIALGFMLPRAEAKNEVFDSELAMTELPARNDDTPQFTIDEEENEQPQETVNTLPVEHDSEF